MLKFSGYSYLIRGQPWGGCFPFNGRDPEHALSEVVATTLGVTAGTATGFRGLRAAAGPQHKPGA